VVVRKVFSLMMVILTNQAIAHNSNPDGETDTGVRESKGKSVPQEPLKENLLHVCGQPKQLNSKHVAAMTEAQPKPASG
jgi:hypothetical protein